jgi:hypothetical protein
MHADRGRSLQFFYCALSQSIHNEFCGFSTANLISTRKSGKKLKANLSKKYVFAIFFACGAFGTGMK